MANAVIIGAGIIGLSTALYLAESGWEVTVIDKTDLQNNCSYGNMGYVCPSHFIPLATPGIIRQGLKWMLNPESPFYIQPRLSKSLLHWGYRFLKSANTAHVERSALPLAQIANLSKTLYEAWSSIPGFEFGYKPSGLLEYFKTAQNADHAQHTVETALSLGLEGTMVLNKAEAQAMEPQTTLNIAGAIYFECDAMLWPNMLMKNLLQLLKTKAVTIISNEQVIGFEKAVHRVKKIKTNKAVYDADLCVVAAGSWSRELTEQLQVKMPLVGGRGYSFTLKDSPYHLNYPAILTEGRVAITPIQPNLIRFGGTMEITSTNAAPNYNRVQGIVKAVKDFLPDFTMEMPAKKDIWYGYRPCSADGLPYIGRINTLANCIIATGHSMLGISLGAATGKLVSELANEQPTSIDIKAFEVHRFD